MRKRTIVGILVAVGGVALVCLLVLDDATERGGRRSPAAERVPDRPGREQDRHEPPRGTARVTGRVRLGPDGRWGVGIEVHVATRIARSASSGHFAADVSAGEPLVVAAHAEGFERARLEGAPLAAGEERDVGVLWLQRAGALVVRVVDGRGDPVPGARVVAAARGWFRRPGKRLHEATTGADGRADMAGIAGASWRVSAFRDGYGAAARTVELRGGGAEILLRLGAEHVLRGRVVDDTGQPVPGISIVGQQGTFVWGADTMPVGVVARVNAGDYELRGLHAGTVTLFVRRGSWRTQKLATVRVPAVARYDIELPRTGVVHGTVRREDETPVAGARIYAHSGRWYAYTSSGDDGRYRFDDFPASNHAGASASKRPALESLAPGGFPVRPGETVRRDLVVVPAAGHVRGTVVDAHGPLPGAKVLVQDAEGTHATHADAHGRFAVRTSGGAPYLVTARMPGFYHPGAPVDLERAWKDKRPGRLFVGAGAEPVRLVLEPGAAVAGVVVDERGEPAPHVGVRASRITEPEPNHTKHWYSHFAATDARGRFRFVVAPGRRFQLSVNDPHWTARSHAVVIAGDGPDVRLVAVAHRQVRVRGTLRDHTGTPLPHAAVVAHGHTATTDAEGRFALDVRANGPKVHVAAAGMFQHLGGASVDVAGRCEVEVDIRLRKHRPVAGIVVAADGRPLAGARVGLSSRRDARGELVGSVTGADGRFAFPHAPLWYSLEARAAGYVPRKVPVRVTRIVLQPARRIAGVLRTMAGRPVRGASVVAGATSRAVTDDQGRFVLHDVAPGKHLLRFSGLRSTPKVAPGVARRVRAGRTDIVLRAREAGAVAGRIEGPWVGRLDVRIGDRGAEVGEDGSFRVDGVPLGTHRLEVRKHVEGPDDDNAFVVATVPRVATGTDGLHIAVRLDGEIRGAARGATEEAWIVACARGSAVRAASARVRDGSFRLRGLPPGTYDLKAIVDGETPVDLDLVASPGDTNLDLDLAR